MTAEGEWQLSPEQVAQFERDGYLLLPGFLSAEEVEKCKARVDTLLDEFTLEGHPMTKFSTGEKSDHVGDDYFLNSGNKIRYFFEEDAFDPETGSLARPKERAINKIGHGLHFLDPVFSQISLNSRTRDIAKKIGFKDPRMLQSMIICKQPEIGGKVPSHQDSCFLYTNPPSAMGLWFALEDCTKQNGCLSFVPGSHKRFGITKRMVRGGTGTEFIPIDGVPANPPESDDEFVMGECPAGTLVLIHGNILHKSENNTSDKSRFIYTFHMIEGDNEYDERNWLQPDENGFTRVFTS